VLVALAAPGDRLRVRVDRVKGSVDFASIIEIIDASPARVEPPCPYFGRCGGCDFQQLNYQAQLAAKIEIIRDCLRRIGGLDHIPDFPIVPAPNEWHYRSRAQWQYGSLRRRLGYFEGGSRRVCDVAECAVLVPELQAELERLRKLMQEGALADEARYFRAIAGDDAISIADDNGRDPTVREGAATRDVTRTIYGEQYSVTADSFFQTNIDLLPQLIDEAIGAARGNKAVELYCGVGLFTVPLARRFERVIGIESDAPATEFARRNLAEAGLANAKVVNQNVADWLEQNLARAGSDALDRVRDGAASELQEIDFLLLDPPRTGAESRVIAGILKLKPKKICYVSCDPATLARDLKKLIADGYTISKLVAFDMFPQTHHVETVVHLCQKLDEVNS
jgi:23S rRNA (uracil1939-C5)-methyltransferase